MTNHIADQRIGQLKLDLLKEKPVEVSFDGDDVSGNGGLLLLAQVEKQTQLVTGVAERLNDHRTACLIKHNQFELVMQRVLQIAAGFSACDDSDFLKGDPALKIATGRNPLSDNDLASQPTQSRLENNRTYKELYRLSEWLVDYYIQCHRRRPKQIILDFDGSAIETHGTQLKAFYRSGPYKKFMYFPLFVFDQHGWLLVAALRPGDEGEVNLALPVLKRLVKKLRQAWPGINIVMRADGAYTNASLYQWLDDNNVQYTLGLKHNNTLLTYSKPMRQRVKDKFNRKYDAPLFTGKHKNKRKLAQIKALRSITDKNERHKQNKDAVARRARVYGQFMYQANSWDRQRMVVCRCDFSDDGIEVRYIVTNIKAKAAQDIYEQIYCQRAVAELWIKNVKETNCQRLSCCQFKANMFRLLLHAMAYLLIHQVRQQLSVRYKHISVSQFRRHFVHVAVQIVETKHKVSVRTAQSYHAARDFRTTSKRLGAHSSIAA